MTDNNTLFQIIATCGNENLNASYKKRLTLVYTKLTVFYVFSQLSWREGGEPPDKLPRSANIV